MVTKTSTTVVAKKNTASTGKKPVTKSATKKVSTAKVKSKKIKLIDKQVPVKENVNPVEKVLAIKAKNEDKKAAKISPVTSSAQEVVTKTKKPIAEKQYSLCSCKCKDGICASWAKAYKNMFNFKGRSSRYEFWGFMLLNFIFAIVMLSAFNVMISFSTNNIMVSIGLGGISAFILIEIITYLSLFVRRLHDTGHSSWKGFFRPLTFSSLLCGVFFVSSYVIITRLGDSLVTLASNVQLSLLAYILLFFIVLIFTLYYLTKLVIFSCFAEEDEQNIYGDACYNDKFYRAKALKYAVLYCTLITILNLIIEVNGDYYSIGQY